MFKSFLVALGIILAGLFGGHNTNGTFKTQPAAIAVAVSSNETVPATTRTSSRSSPIAPAFVSTGASSERQSSPTDIPAITVQPAPAVVLSDYVTQDELAAQLQEAANDLRSLIYQNESAPNSPPASGGYTNEIAVSNHIDQLNGTTLNKVTVNGISGLVATDIPVLNYFPATSTISVSYGGTGTSTSPHANELLVSDSNGNWEYAATSSLGIGATSPWTTAGSNVYFGSGNVGIGTTSPFANLGVNGTAYVSGALTAPIQDLGGAVYNVAAYGIVPDGTDQTAKFIALLGIAYNGGGGVIQFNKGTYVFLGQLKIPNDGGSTPSQPSLRITGAGDSANGEGGLPSGGTILDMRFTGTPAKIDTRGLGNLEIDHVTLTNTGTDGTPYIQTTNTTLHIDNVEFYGKLASGNVPDEDAIVLGGTTTNLDGTGSAAFQGYGTVIEDDYFNRIRRGVYLLTYANGVVIRDNTWWTESGGIAAIDSEGYNSGNTNSGLWISGNVIEVNNYTYGIKLANTDESTITGNNYYDPTSTTVAAVDLESSALFNLVQDGFHADSILGVNDLSGGKNTILTAHQNQTSTWSQPWTFSNSLILNNGGFGPTIEDSSGDTYTQQVINAGGDQLRISYTPSGASTDSVGDWFAASATDMRLQLLGTTNSRFEAPNSQLQVYSQTGQALFLGDASNNVYVLGGTLYSTRSSNTASVKMTNTGSLQWSGTSAVSAGTDVGLTRNAAGVLEIDSGTAGTLRDLAVRSLNPSSGNLGVGTTTPYSKLTVWGPDVASTSPFAVVNSASTTVFAVYDNGNASYSGSIFQSSDQRLKTNVQTLDASSSLAAIEALNPVSYLRLDQPSGGENLGFLAQAVQKIFPELVSTTSATALTPDGTLTLNYEGLISPIVAAIQALGAELASLEATVAGFANNIVSAHITATTGDFQQVNTNDLCVGSTCVTPAQFQAMVAAAGEPNGGRTVSAPASTDATDTPPVISINGGNPAIIQVGETYADLGATITGPQTDINLGITTYVNGIEMSPVQIDTNTVATDTIDYVVTDTFGNTATSTRTVIIEAAADTATTTSTGSQI